MVAVASDLFCAWFWFEVLTQVANVCNKMARHYCTTGYKIMISPHPVLSATNKMCALKLAWSTEITGVHQSMWHENFDTSCPWASDDEHFHVPSLLQNDKVGCRTGSRLSVRTVHETQIFILSNATATHVIKVTNVTTSPDNTNVQLIVEQMQRQREVKLNGRLFSAQHS